MTQTKKTKENLLFSFFFTTFASYERGNNMSRKDKEGKK